MKRTICLAMAVLILLSACGAEAQSTKTIYAMDTYMTLTAYGGAAEDAIAAAQAEIERLDALLSIGEPTGEVCTLNAGGGGEAGEEVCTLTQTALELWERTGGAFDITVLPLMELWGFTDGEYRVPTEAELTETLKSVGSDKVSLDGKTLHLSDGVRVDFGGIAKGYTSDRVVALMAAAGVESAIVSLGGNVQTLGSKPDGSDWRVAIRSPWNSTATLGVLSVKNTAVVTSGGYERYFEQDGATYHHILDPDTGCPAQSGLASVTVVCAEGVTADALSTALYVMGLDRAAEFWRGGGYAFEAVFAAEDGGLYITAGLAESFTPASGYEDYTVIGAE